MMSKAFQDGALGYATGTGYVVFLIFGLANVALLRLGAKAEVDCLMGAAASRSSPTVALSATRVEIDF
jgi:hypothetical protein